MNEYTGPDAPPPGGSQPAWSPPPGPPPPPPPPYGQYGQYGQPGPYPPPAGPADAPALVRDLSLPLYRARDWLRLMGVLMIVAGALYALSLVGIIVAWLPIWMGVLLFKAAGAIERAHQRGEPRAMIESQDKLRTYFTVQAVLAIASVVLAGIMMVVMSVMGLGISQLFRNLD
jgi:hypothetical protein